MVPLSECNSDIRADLRRCHLTKENVTEIELVLRLARYFNKSANKSKICLSAQNIVQTQGRSGEIKLAAQPEYRYPDHKGKKKGPRPDPEVLGVFGISIPVGSRK